MTLAKHNSLSARGPALRGLAGLVAVGVALGVATRAAADATEKPSGRRTDSRPSVFAFPRIQSQLALLHAEMTRLFSGGQYGEAEKACRLMIDLQPDVPTPRYNLACALARQGRAADALDALREAIARGFNDVATLDKDPDLASLRNHRDWKAVREAARRAPRYVPEQRTVTPAPPRDGVAWVTESNTAWNSSLGVLQTLVVFPPPGTSRAEVVTGDGPGEKLLRQWYAEGSAAGNWGDLYDNRDGKHSSMNVAKFPQLTRVEYAPEAQSNLMLRGLQAHLLFNRVTIGNASIATTAGAFWRSMPRHAYPDAGLMAILHAQYAGNHVYVYPEHRDYDPGHNGEGGGYGDVYCANTPYVIISQGSSGSDRPFLDALAFTLASFRPEVKERLAARGSLMAALQMILRACSRRVEVPEDYLEGKAHPAVFDSRDLDVIRMIHMAHDMTLSDLPPEVAIRVLEEDPAVPGRDYFDPRPTEVLFDTPAAVARVVRSMRYLRRMVVSAEGSRDPNGQPLRYHWRVLSGDADRIRIRPLTPQGSSAEILVPYHERHPAYPGAPIEGNRVDLGVFAHNGKRFSAPAFVSLFYLDNEKRTYDEQHRILSVQYSGAETPGNYVDPMLDLPKDWRDDYHYDADGRLTGWTRTLGETRQEFLADGRLIVRRDETGKPLETRAVRYAARRRSDGRFVLEQQEIP